MSDDMKFIINSGLTKEDVLFLSIIELRRKLMETNLTMKDVRRVMKIRRRERTRALDEREELETEEKITSLSNLKQELMEEQSKLQREVEMYRIMEFLNSPSDQQWMKQLLTHSNWQHWYEHSTITKYLHCS